MKRTGFIILAVIIALIGVMAILPLFFKGAISEKVKTAINHQINAKVNFEGFHISLFNQFPRVEIGIDGLSIAGTGDFKNDTLASIGTITSTITLSELFRSKQLQITNLTAENTHVLLKALKNGAVNWDVAVTSEPGTPAETKKEEPTSEGLTVKLDDIQLKNFNLKYLDEEMGLLFGLKNAELLSNGKITGTVTEFDINTSVAEMLVEYDSVQYVSNLALKGVTQMLFDYDKMDFRFNNGKIWLNDLTFNFGGQFAMPSDSMYFDLNLANESKDFNSLLALVPKDYKSYLEKVKAEGSAAISANFKGWYYEENYPALDFKTEISNATFRYTDLPESIQKINLKMAVSKPQGDLDLTVINISEASAELKNTPVKMRLTVATPVSDPAFAGQIAGKIDFTALSQAIPMEGSHIQGKLSIDMALEGHQSDVEKSQYEKFKSNGKVVLENFVFQSDQLKQPVNITSGTVLITTPKIEVKSLFGNLGQSKFQLTGQLSNYLLYFLKNQTLTGDFTLGSDFINLTELATIQTSVPDSLKSKTQTAAPADSILAFEVPDKLDLKFRSAIKHAQFDRMKIDNINGLISLKDRKLELSNLDMEMLQGKLTVTGSYLGNAAKKPDFDFSLNVAGFDVNSAYQSVTMMQRYLPVAAKSQGKISTTFHLKGKMNEKLELIGPSLDGNGMFNTQNLMIVDSPTFDQLKNVIKSEKLKNIKVDDFTAKFSMETGNLVIKPFHTVIADQETTIQGKVSVQSELDILLDFKLNREDFGGDINKVLSLIPGSDNIKKVDVGVNVVGPLKSPQVKVNLDKARQQILEEVKKAGAKEIQDKVKKIGNELKKLFK